MPSPLNPVLFKRLQEELGRVQIVQAGVAASLQYIPDQLYKRGIRLELLSKGEYYRANCPYCGDQRGRLWVNHLWGVPDEVTASDNLWLAVCYNEDCLAGPERPRQLYNRLFEFKNVGQRDQIGKIVILQGEQEDTTLREVSLPGEVLRLDRVAPEHPVCTYLISRGLNPTELGRTYSTSLCTEADSNYPMAQGRIVVPIIMRGLLVGWQCRYPKDIDFKLAGIPKYYNRPNMARRLMLYNFDNAIQSPYVVICEGVTDVWSVGPQSVAAFGKKLSKTQVQMICEDWKDGAVIILLDGDAWEDSQALADCFEKECGYSGAIIPVRLPSDKDPGDLDRSVLWEFIDDEAAKCGVTLSSLQRSSVPTTNRRGIDALAIK